MILVAGSVLALVAGVLLFRKPRRNVIFIMNAIIYELRYNAIGVIELFKDRVYAKYNKTDLLIKTGRIAIVTGGSRGIGSAVAEMLLKCEMEVIIACRNKDAGNKAIKAIRESGITSGIAKVYQLDNSSLDSVRKFTEEIKRDYKRIDILINNAGIMFTPFKKTIDGFEQQWEVNYLSHFLLTSLLINLLNNRGEFDESARIVNVTSCAHLVGTINFDNIDYEREFLTKFAYAQSKLAQVMFTKSIQELFTEKNFNIKSYAVHPGIVNTDLFQHSFMKHLKLFSSFFFKNIEQGATPIVFAALNKSLEDKAGIYISNCLESPVNPQTLDSALRNRLFQLSLKQVQLEDFINS